MNLKKPKTYYEQIELLKSKGLSVDENFAENVLRKVGYYRLSGYYKFFYDNLKLKNENHFREETDFIDIYNIYLFDKELRNLIFIVICDIEIHLKSSISYTLSHDYGTEALKKENIIPKSIDEFLQKELSRYSKKEIIKHHRDNYESKYPIWVVMEILSLGTVSRIYKLLPTKNKKEIARNYYNHKHQYLEQWFETVTYIRNKCAHHERLIGENINIKMDKSMQGHNAGSLFVFLIAIKTLLSDELQWNVFVEKLSEIIDKYEFSRFDLIGFDENWKEILKKKD